MEKGGFKKLQKKDLKDLKGGKGECTQNGDEIYEVGVFTLEYNQPHPFPKKEN